MRRCEYCESISFGSFLKNYWNEVYCTKHTDIVPCNYCQSIKYVKNGICKHCSDSLVNTEHDVIKNILSVKKWLNSKDIHINKQVSIKLVENNYFNLLGNKGQLASFEYSGLTYFGKSSESFTVKINNNLPSSLFKGISVHEFGHLFLHTLGINTTSKEEEGFCQLLSFYFYLETNEKLSPYLSNCIENDPSDIYGNGFRLINSRFKKFGNLPEYISKICKTRNLL